MTFMQYLSHAHARILFDDAREQLDESIFRKGSKLWRIEIVSCVLLVGQDVLVRQRLQITLEFAVSRIIASITKTLLLHVRLDVRSAPISRNCAREEPIEYFFRNPALED